MILAARLVCLFAAMAFGIAFVKFVWLWMGYQPTFDVKGYAFSLIDMGTFAFGYWWIYHEREPYGLAERRRSSSRG